MNEEIIEILEEMKEYASGGMTGLYLPEYMIQDLLDYITNLQQTVEQLESIRKEAIKYVQEKADYPISYYHCLNDLLNILSKGE